MLNENNVLIDWIYFPFIDTTYCLGMRVCLVGLLEMAPAEGLTPIDDAGWQGTELESVTQKWR